MNTILLKLLKISTLAGCLCFSFSAFGAPPVYDHVVIVVEENTSYSSIIGNTASAPYINSLATGGVSFTTMRSITHPSQPNYLEMFSGDNQGSTSDGSLAGTPFSTPNFGAALIATGRTFAGYSEGLPAEGDITTSSTTKIVNGTTYTSYVRYHCPWWVWCSSVTPTPANQMPLSVHKKMTQFPTDYSTLPTVSFVIPDYTNDMHGPSPSGNTILTGDTWLQANLSGYAEWAKTHNSLLIVVWDEDNFQAANRIPMIFYGANLRNSGNAGTWTLHNLLRTLEDMYETTHSGRSANVQPIVGAFSGEAPVATVSFQQGANGYSTAHDTYLSSTLPANSFGTVDIAGSTSNQGLIRFDNITGTTAGLIPSSASILSAKLVTNTFLSTAPVNARAYRMLAPWTEASTWNSMGAGISANGVEASTLHDSSITTSSGANSTFDATASVSAWKNGSPNYGWAILTTTGEYFLLSAERSTVSQRPVLEITATASTVQFDAASLDVTEIGAVVQVTARRVGLLDGAVSVAYLSGVATLPHPGTGNATAGADYTSVSGTLTWLAGDGAPQTISIPILADTLNEADETFGVTLYSPVGFAVLGQSAINIHIRETPWHRWLAAQFGATGANDPLISGDNIDRDGDGSVNLLEYAAGTDPQAPAQDAAPTVSMAGTQLVLTFRRDTAATDLTYIVQVSSDLVNWDDGSSYAPAASTPTNTFTTEVSHTSGAVELISISDNTVTSSPRYMRLKVIRTP